MDKVKRRSLPQEVKDQFALAWQESLANPQPPSPKPFWVKEDKENGKSFVMIKGHNLIFDWITEQRKVEGLPDLEVKERFRLTGEIGALYIAPNFGHPNGVELCLEAIEEGLLNGWPFSEKTPTPKALRKIPEGKRQELLMLVVNMEYNQAKIEAFAILSSVMSLGYFVENAEDDKEVNDELNALIAEFDEMEILEFLSQFELRVLNHPKLKESQSLRIKPPVQGDFFIPD